MGDWNELAGEGYAAASVLIRDQLIRSGVSRAYYAAYSRVTQALVALGSIAMPSGRQGPVHGRLAALVESHLTSLGARRWTVSSDLRTLYKLRLMADYQPSVALGSADGRTALGLMGRVFQSTRGAV